VFQWTGCTASLKFSYCELLRCFNLARRGHWSLLILCNLGESLESENGKPCMLLLDSLENAGPGRIEPDLRKFLLDIYRSEGRAVNKKLIHQIPLLIPKSLVLEPQMNRTWFTPDCLQQFFEELDLVKKAV
ncbi:unnamed protein product, partial [Linum tenue]